MAGISFDSMDEHRRFAREHDIRFPLIPDEKGAIRKAGYGQGRVSFVIDTRGIIRHVEKGVPDNERLLEVLRSLQD